MMGNQRPVGGRDSTQHDRPVDIIPVQQGGGHFDG